MPLHVVAGLPGVDLGGRMLALVAEAPASSLDVAFALPDDTAAESARAALALVSPVGPRVGTLDGLIEAEWALRGDGRRIAGGVARDVILARALTDARVVETPRRGFVSLLGMLVERSRGDVTSARGEGLSERLVRAVAIYRKLLDEHGAIERADVCRFLGAYPPAPRIVVHGFGVLEPRHEELLCAWSSAGADVTVSLAWAPDCAGTEAVTPLVERLRACGASVEVVSDDAVPRPDELRRARAGLFAGPEPSEGSGAVRLAVAEGLEGEAQYIAGVTGGLIAAGAAPESITVAFGDPGRHASSIRRALDEAGVPAVMSVPVPVGETTFGAALLALRDAALRGLPVRDVAMLLRNPFGGLALDDADAANLALRRAGVAHGRAVRSRSGALAPLLDRVIPLASLAIDVAIAKKWKSLADELMANGYRGAAPVPDAAALLDAAAHRSFCRHLDEALGLGEGAVSAAELWDAYASARVMPRIRRAAHVAVTSIDRVASEGASHIIIGGLTASECPSRGSEDRLEGDAVARALRMLGVEAEADDSILRQRRAFYLAVASAEQSLTLTRRGADDEGSPTRESVFWDEFLDLYRTPGEVLPEGQLPRIEPAQVGRALGGGASRIERGRIDDPAILEDLAAITEVSPSEIETYASCPYRWFIERRVRAESPDRDVDPAAVGKIVHDALATFYRERLEQGDSRVKKAEVEVAMARAAAIATDAVTAAGEPEALEAASLMRSAVPAVVGLVSRDVAFLPGFAPAHMEWAFGGSSEVPAVDLGGVSLKGRADRIDIGPEGLVIVDYKRTYASTLREIRDGGLVQLQLYAAAARSVFGVPAVGGVYRGLRDGTDRGFVRADLADAGGFYRNDLVDADQLEELIGEAIETARAAADGMRAGRIERTPSDRACRYCAASAFCDWAVGA